MKANGLTLSIVLVSSGLFASLSGAAGESDAGFGIGPGAVFASLPYAGPPDSLEAVVASSAMMGQTLSIPMPFAEPNGTAPTFTVQPASQSAATGASVTFSAAATGTPAPVFQWLKNGRFIWGANSATYTIASAQPDDAGAYKVEVYNGAGFATSDTATLSVSAAGVVTAAPVDQSIATGETATFSVTAAGAGLTYQWQFDGLSIPGATSSTYTLANAGPGASGAFAVVISSGAGVVAEEVATLSVVTNARLSNLSARGLVGTGDENLIVGFDSRGTGSKQILLRGVGPTLATEFGVTGALMTPELTLTGERGSIIATNTSWGGTAALSQAFAQVGAFALPAGSADAALLETLPTGSYTAEVSGLNGSTGIALAELYDADTGTPTASLVNVSARAYVANGGNVLIAGFVVDGPSSETVLIRGIGPTLKGLFGFLNALAKTQVELFDSGGNQIAANAGWGNDPWISGTGTQVGAFPMMAGSMDSALLVTIPPGSYTAQVSGAAGATGVGMVEIYEVR
jgi:hypothetical protein